MYYQVSNASVEAVLRLALFGVFVKGKVIGVCASVGHKKASSKEASVYQ